MNSGGLEHIHTTILEIIIDKDEVDNQTIFEQVKEMMSLLGETIQENEFLKQIEKLLDMNYIAKVDSTPSKYKITDNGKKIMFGELI